VAFPSIVVKIPSLMLLSASSAKPPKTKTNRFENDRIICSGDTFEKTQMPIEEEIEETRKEQEEKAKRVLAEHEKILTEIERHVKEKNANKQTPKGEAMVELARQFIGFDEIQMEEEAGYDLPDGLWCAAFVKYIASEINSDNLPDWYFECYNKCSAVLDYAKENNAVLDDYNEAKPGDIVIFNLDGKIASHIGLVASIKDGILTTIEGNATKKALVVSKEYDLDQDKDKINSFIRLIDR